MKLWKDSAPSNIALVKYMGKMGANQAVNPSLSMTLENFFTRVEIEPIAGQEDRWQPLKDCTPLRVESTKKFMDFFQKLKKEWEVTGSFEVRSGNNFPSDAGLASSASSFAALTKTALRTFSEITGKPLPHVEQMAQISRTGSGSSCRSFFSPWCLWEEQGVKQVPSRMEPLVDLVVILEEGFKKVSSSQAHQRVKTSPLFQGRIARAEKRCQEACTALQEANYQKLAEISWAELWDMHSLFHTSEPPFFYFAPGTIEVLRWVEDQWEKKGTGPIATIDAGPNVHLLMPKEMVEETKRVLKFPFMESL